jgi:hypothetical protein
MKIASAITTCVAILSLAVPPANADFNDPTAELSDEGTVTVGIKLVAPGAEGAEGGSTPLVGYVSYQYFDGTAQPGDLSGLCSIGDDFGALFRVVGTTPDGTIVDDHTVCVPFTEGDPTPHPPPLPQPPTVAEAWNAAKLPAPVITTDPATRGITGLETRISTTGPTTITIDATIRGYRVVGTATLDHYTVSVDGGSATNTDHSTYTFETKGMHTIEIRAVWRGTATLTGPDLLGPITLGDIGTATITTTRQYPVHEVRSELTR